jgi:hypothetical protein
MTRSQRGIAAAIGAFASLSLDISHVFANESSDPSAHPKAVFSDVVIPKHFLCLEDEEFLMRTLSSYKEVITGVTIDESGETVRTNRIYVDPNTKDLVIVGFSMKRKTFCITEVLKNVQVHHTEVLDKMEGQTPVK